jgi:hypothetical protein
VTKREPGVWESNCATLSLADINTVAWFSRLEVYAKLTTLLRKNITVTKFQEVKTGCNLAESFKEGDGSKRAVLPMMNNIWRSGTEKQFSNANEGIYSFIHRQSEINTRVESNYAATTIYYNIITVLSASILQLKSFKTFLKFSVKN